MSIYQIVWKGLIGTGVECRNVHHYEFPGYVPTTAELQSAIDDLSTDYLVELQAHQHPQLSNYGFDVRRVDLGDQPTLELVAANQPYAGTGLNQLLPRQVALMVRWKAPTAFPRNCRSYLAGFTSTDNDGNGVATASLVTAATAWGDSVEALTVAGQADANKVSVRYGGTPRVVVASNPVTFESVAGTWRTQRRRTPGVGI